MENTMYRKLNRTLGVVLLGLVVFFPLLAGWLLAPSAYAGVWGFTLMFLAPIVCLVSAGFLLLADDDKTVAIVVLGLWAIAAMIVALPVIVSLGA